jgi:DNA-binding PadR family transcriptional regulator
VSGVNSGVVYRELERLKSENLVFQLGVNQKKYEAINGNGLIEILKADFTILKSPESKCNYEFDK